MGGSDRVGAREEVVQLRYACCGGDECGRALASATIGRSHRLNSSLVFILVLLLALAHQGGLAFYLHSQVFLV